MNNFKQGNLKSGLDKVNRVSFHSIFERQPAYGSFITFSTQVFMFIFMAFHLEFRMETFKLRGCRLVSNYLWGFA